MSKPRSGADKAPAQKRRGGPSGVNTLTEVKLRADDEEIEIWKTAAKRLGVNRNTFLRRAANQLSDEVLACDK